MKNNHLRIPNITFKKIMKLVPICTVDIVLLNLKKNKILLCKRKNKPLNGLFFTNGGRLFKNEELDAAAVRIAHEELGITLNKTDIVLGGILNQINDTSIFKNINYHVMDVFFECIIDESIKITLDNQHSTYKWFSVNDKSLHPDVRKMLDALKTKSRINQI